jgi:hypothetical protein
MEGGDMGIQINTGEKSCDLINGQNGNGQNGNGQKGNIQMEDNCFNSFLYLEK